MYVVLGSIRIKIPIHTGQNKKHIGKDVLFIWWRHRDSNPGPPACKAGALAN